MKLLVVSYLDLFVLDFAAKLAEMNKTSKILKNIAGVKPNPFFQLEAS